MTRRANGEGSIRQRKDDGRWTWEIMTGYAADGKKEVRRGSAKSQQAAIRARDLVRRQLTTGALVEKTKERTTVQVYLLSWLAGKAGTIRPSTLKRYTDLLTQHVLPTLGRLRLAAVKPEQIRLLYAHLRLKLVVRVGYQDTPKQLSEATVHHVHVALKMAFRQAVTDGYCHQNPCLAIKMPRVPVPQTTTPSVADIQRLLTVTQGTPLCMLWTLAVNSGCRIGELLGLQWPDVNMGQQTIMIRRTLLGSSGGAPRFGAPKTSQSVRTIFLSASVMLPLQRYREEQSADHAGYQLLFATAVGRPLLYSNVLRSFKQALAAAGLVETIRLHDCRHFAATTMMKGQVPLKVVSRRLGHANIGITAQLYQHPDASDDQAAAEAMDLALSAGINAGTAGILPGQEGGNLDKIRTIPEGTGQGEPG